MALEIIDPQLGPIVQMDVEYGRVPAEGAGKG